MQEAHTNTIEVEEDPILLTHLLEALYTYRLAIPDTRSIIPLLLLAEQYMLVQCKTSLVEFLLWNITKENAMDCLNLNMNTYPDIKRAFVKYCYQNSQTILEGDSFIPLDAEKMTILMGVLANRTHGMKCIEAKTRWIEHNTEERTVFSHALTKIIVQAQSASKQR
jgi:hypothetical protein